MTGNAEVEMDMSEMPVAEVTAENEKPKPVLENMRVLVVSHGITEQTGFAQQMRKVSTFLQANGAKVFAAHPRYRGEPTPVYNGVTILPWGNDPHGADCMHYYIDLIQPQYVITLADIWDKQYLSPDNTTKLRHKEWSWLGWFPFDTSNTLTFWNGNLNKMTVPVCMSEFGKEIMDKNGVMGVHIPHSFDPNIYYPLPDDKKAEMKSAIRRRMQVPDDTFMVLCVAHNQVRKKMDRVLRAFAEFVKTHPNSILWFHCSPNDNTGWDLAYIATELGVSDKVFFSNKAQKLVSDAFVSNKDMADMYRAADVHILLTGGEGFGLPLMEAAACGIPNITTDFTTGPELVGVCGGGFLVPVDATEMHQNGGLWALASIDKAAEFLGRYYDDRGLLEEHGRRAAEYVHGKYTDAKVLPKWIELMAATQSIKEQKKGAQVAAQEQLKPVRYVKM